MQEQQNNTGTIERLDPTVNTLIDEDAKIEIIAEGMDWAEGPLWLETENMLIFSDVPANTIYKWSEEKGKEVYLTPSGYTGSIPRGGETGSNGLLLDPQGKLVLCQHGNRQMAMMDAGLNDPKPVFTTIADNYQGKKLNSPNDAVYNKAGELFFTDPPYGLVNNAADSSKEIPFQGVFKVKTTGEVILLVDSITRPNGIAFSPDEKRLYIANSDPEKAYWYEYEVGPGDSLINGKILYDATVNAKSESGLPDGFKVDKNGNIFATGPGGVWIFNNEGKLIGKIKINSATSNCAFSPDEKTLYVTADMNLVRITLRK